LKAVNFTPLKGEIIIYSKDENYDYDRIKIGDGISNVNSLPFITTYLDEKIGDINTALENILLLQNSYISQVEEV